MADLITDAELLSLGALAGTLTADVSSSDRANAISAASSEVLSYLRKRFGLPLVSWSDDIKQVTADLAAYRLIRIRGYNPANGRDATAREAALEAREWLKNVALGVVEPEAVSDSTASTEEQAPLITSSGLRGFGRRNHGVSDEDERLL